MINQTVLGFKVEATSDVITPHAGLALLGEFGVGLGVLGALDRDMPEPGSAVRYRASEHIFPVLLMLNRGGRTLEDTRQIRKDEGLREVLGLERIPSSDPTGDWLPSSGGDGGLEGLEKVNRRLLKRGMKYDGMEGYRLDIDATGIEADKESAEEVVATVCDIQLVADLIDIAILEKKPDQVLRWYDQRPKGRFGWYGVDEDAIATAVQTHAPDRAVTIWKNKAERLIAQVKPSAYQEAAKYLRKAAKVMRRGKKLAEWKSYLKELREQHLRKRRLMEILDGLDGKPIEKKRR